MNQGIVFVNGEFFRAQDAKISIFDRGFTFADSVYEVIPVYQGKPLFVERHLQRLEYSLAHTRIPMPKLNWNELFVSLTEQNGWGDMQIYLQITRGNQWVRKHDLPTEPISPTVVAFTLHNSFPNPTEQIKGLKATLVEDIRWQRCDIKTTSMLGHVLVNDEAISSGAATAILYRDHLVTEGSASNVFMVSNGKISTPPMNRWCLPGITRQILIELINKNNLPFAEEDIPVNMLVAADEVFITSTTKELYPITSINQQTIGTGSAGPMWQQLNLLFQAYIKEQL